MIAAPGCAPAGVTDLVRSEGVSVYSGDEAEVASGLKERLALLAPLLELTLGNVGSAEIFDPRWRP